MFDDIDVLIRGFFHRVISFLPDLVAAIIYLIVGLILIRVFRRFMNRLMGEKKHDPTVLKFLMDLLTWVFRVFLIIIVISRLGVETSSFVAVLGAAGLAVGLSLQGSLSNFAGGLLIIMFKPLRVGDYVEAQGESGTVAAIRIFNTKLITPNNQVIYLPNGQLSNGTIRNFSKEPTRRAEIVIGVGYGTDLRHVKQVLLDIIHKDSRILTEPAPAIAVKQLAPNSVDLAIHIWASNENYGVMVSDFYENVKESFYREHIEIPAPQREIKVVQVDKP